MQAPTVLIWDVSGTLYSHDADYYQLDYRTVAAVIAELDIMPFEQALAEAEKSKHERGSTYAVFLEKYGVDFATLDTRFCEKLLKDPLFACPWRLVHDAFAKLPESITNVILSHGKEPWVRAVITKIGLGHFFAPEHIFSASDPALRKNQSTKPFLIICQALGVEPSACTMIDDSPENLVFPKKLGMKTVLITGQNLFAEKAPDANWIDERYPTILEFLRQI
jgi:putative hydrolase of the HAD superfamily